MKTKATGVVDFFTTVPAAARARATRHLVVSVLALLTFGVAWFLRGGIGGDVEAPELIVEAVGALLVGLSGFLGGSFVVVTGASSGIGAVAARRLAQRGATVVPVGRSRTATAAIAAEMGPNR